MNKSNPKEFSEFPVLETKRLVLREIVPADAEEILLFTGDPIVQSYNAEPMTDISEALVSIEQERAIYVRQDGVLWGITLKNEDKVIGRVGFSAWSYSNHAIWATIWLRLTEAAGSPAKRSVKSSASDLTACS